MTWKPMPEIKQTAAERSAWCERCLLTPGMAALCEVSTACPRAKGETVPPERNQITKIHIAKSELAMDDHAYRDLLADRYGVGSSLKLTPTQADDLLAHFKRLGWKVKPSGTKRRYKPDPGKGLQRPERRLKPVDRHIGPVSAAQRTKIEALAMVINWRTRDGLNHFCLRMIGREAPAYFHEAHKFIEILKGFRNRQIRDEFRAGRPWAEIEEHYRFATLDPSEPERIWKYANTEPRRRKR